MRKIVSPLPGQFLTSLRDIMQKHKVDITVSSTMEPSHANNSNYSTAPSALNATDNELHSIQHGKDVLDPDLALDASFDEFWRMAMQSEPNLDSIA
jgi:hypothetical protein